VSPTNWKSSIKGKIDLYNPAPKTEVKPLINGVNGIHLDDKDSETDIKIEVCDVLESHGGIKSLAVGKTDFGNVRKFALLMIDVAI
jgi:hypothetical protein